MSHELFRKSIFSNGPAWAFLKRVDEAAAESCRAAGCPHCGGELHCANYPRKPHGLAAELRDDAVRFSFCCATCRRRATPPSARFFGRRFRVAPLFVMASALTLRGGRPPAGDRRRHAEALAAVVARPVPGDVSVADKGLSPLMRGNREKWAFDPRPEGSIPAPRATC